MSEAQKSGLQSSGEWGWKAADNIPRAFNPFDKGKAQSEHTYPQDLYVLLPPRGQPVAIYAQQCRALNLIWALAHRQDSNGKGLHKKNVLVIGAGVAGLTAGVAAALAGASVTILEKASTPLKLQLGCEHRFLHPRFHEWPEVRSHSAAAALPLLTWSVGTAGEVASTIYDQFKQLERQLSQPKSHRNNLRNSGN